MTEASSGIEERYPIIAPSVLAADWGRFAEEITDIVNAGADWVHLDVMDGHFVPPITFGPGIVNIANSTTGVPLDVHLMIEKPERQIESFARAGAKIITVHQEACPHLHRTIESIHSFGIQAGVALNPATPVSTLESIIEYVDLVLIMTVNPGWGGQRYIEACERKITAARNLIQETGKKIYLEVDGGINDSTAKQACQAGADVLVAGSYIFAGSNYRESIELLRAAGNEKEG